MLREEFWLVLHHRGGMGFERFCDLRVQLLTSTAQQAAVCHVLHQRRGRAPRSAKSSRTHYPLR
jgi:hypothetical protein